MKKKKTTSGKNKFFLGALLGIGAGAATMFFSSPKSEKENRKDLKRNAKKITKVAKQKIEKTTKTAEREAKKILKTANNEAKKLVSKK